MKAYLACKECGTHSIVDGNMGLIQCPHCESANLERVEIGTTNPPQWFIVSKEEKEDDTSHN